MELGDVFERYQNTESWGLHARVVDKATAEQFLGKGTIVVQSADPNVAITLRQRHKEACFVQMELPEECGPRDSILLVRKRASGDTAEPGYDNRFHFFLVTWIDPSQLNDEFASLEPVTKKKSTTKTSIDGGSLKKRSKKCGANPTDRPTLEAASTRKRGFRKGLSGAGHPHRWRF
jgi:hypothetical protein